MFDLFDDSIDQGMSVVTSWLFPLEPDLVKNVYSSFPGPKRAAGMLVTHDRLSGYHDPLYLPLTSSSSHGTSNYTPLPPPSPSSLRPQAISSNLPSPDHIRSPSSRPLPPSSRLRHPPAPPRPRIPPSQNKRIAEAQWASQIWSRCACRG